MVKIRPNLGCQYLANKQQPQLSYGGSLIYFHAKKYQGFFSLQAVEWSAKGTNEKYAFLRRGARKGDRAALATACPNLFLL